MKKISLFLLPLFLTVAAAAQTATLSKKSYSMSYPSTWQVSKTCADANCSLLAGSDGAGDTFSENINIVIEKAKDASLTPQKYAEFSKGFLPSKIKKIKFLESKKVRQNGVDGWFLVFNGTQKGLSLQWKQYYFIKNSKIYIITFTAEQKRYDEYLPIINENVATFKVN